MLFFGRIVAGVALVVSCGVGFGQSVAQQFANADWFERPLAPGVTWRYYHFDNLFNARQHISIIEADLNVPGVGVRIPWSNRTQLPTSMIPAQVPSAAAGVNGTFFSWNGHRTFLRANGFEVVSEADPFSNWGFNGGLVYNRTTRQAQVRTPPAAGKSSPAANWRTLGSQWTEIMAGGPRLIIGGGITRNAFPSGSHCSRHPRTMVGMKPGNILLLVVADGRHIGNAAGLTCEEMAQVMLALGCRDAVSMDGGGSSLMYGRGEPQKGILNYPSGAEQFVRDPSAERAVTDAIAVTGNARVPLEYDARLLHKVLPTSVNGGQARTVTLLYENIGSKPWDSGRISVTTARPMDRLSSFYNGPTWEDQSTAWVLPEGRVVAPGSTLQLSFTIRGPHVPTARTITEYFQLTLDGERRFGPGDNEVKLSVSVPASSGVEGWEFY